MPIVIKYGGNAMTDDLVRLEVARTISGAARSGREPIVVHGGGPFIDAELQREGIAAEFVRGLRVTSAQAIGPIERALTLLGKRLAQEIGTAISLSGRDAGLLRARTFDPQLGLVGTMTGVNAPLLKGLLGIGVTPVIACLALGGEGELLNVNADEVAGSVAGSLGVPVVFLTNVPGVLEDPAAPDSRLESLTREQVEERIEDGAISGGMIPKVEAALTALELGATWAVIADGRTPDGLGEALQGKGGTRILPS
ncbi:MAG TPA: acetylglutamate kinase [Trueperaceae bacterium]